jgi:hypothetical protein
MIKPILAVLLLSGCQTPEPEFKYLDYVCVTGGFYAGHVGVVVGRVEYPDEYYVDLTRAQFAVWIEGRNLDACRRYPEGP